MVAVRMDVLAASSSISSIPERELCVSILVCPACGCAMRA